MMLVGAVLLIVRPHMPEDLKSKLSLTSPIGVRRQHRRGDGECLAEGQSHKNEANIHWCNLQYQYQAWRLSKTEGFTNSYWLRLKSSKLSVTGGTKYVCIPENHQDILGHCDNEENVQRSYQIRVSLLLTGRSRLYVQPACSLSSLFTLSTRFKHRASTSESV